MRKITPFLALLLLFPNFVFAAWWNPVSWFNNWSFSSSSDSKTQLLEKRISDLENKLASSTAAVVSASSTVSLPVMATSTVERKKITVTSKSVTPATLTNQGENYNSALVGYLNTEIGFFTKQKQLLDPIVIDAQTEADKNERMVSYLKGATNGSDISKILLDYYSAVNYQQYVDYFKYLQKIDDQQIADINSLISSTISVGFISLQDYKLKYQTYSSKYDSKYKELDADITTYTNNYFAYSKQIENEVATIQGKLDALSAQANTKETYVPPSPPSVNFSQTSCQASSGSINCITY